MTSRGVIRAGIGGWTFEPWRGTFYPKGVKQKDELTYAASHLTAIEINGTYYSEFKPDSWIKWRDATPDGFVFAVKALRFTTNRKVLAEAGESVNRFLAQGLTLLGPKLGPILWQFAPSKKFDAADFGAFLALLPKNLDGLRLRHVVEVRNPTFVVPEFAALLRHHNVAVCYAKHFDYPEIADVTADFVYARLQTGSDDVPTAYPPHELDAWADRLKAWAEGGEPSDLPKADPDHKPTKTPRDVFAFIIHEGKVNAPQGAMALIERVR
ncbi:DUF72 domain-containing protein [Caulobacter sp. LARHSG274]